MAKNMLKSQLRDNKKQIHGDSRNNNTMNASFLMTEEEDRVYMRECRKKIGNGREATL
jgi:hypothetical protein